VSGRPVRVVNIRGARPKPGLQPQHLLAVKAAARLCAATVAGAALGSTEVTFCPGSLCPPATWELDVGTAGSVMLLLQGLLPALVKAGSSCTLRLRGGTNNPWAPPFEHFEAVLLPVLAALGAPSTATLEKRGFYPRGGGLVQVRVPACGPLRALTLLERDELEQAWGLAYSSNLPEHIGQRMAQAAKQSLWEAGLREVKIARDTETPSAGPGCGIILFARFSCGAILAGSALGERGKPAEKVGREAAHALLEEVRSGAPVDRHLGDQLVIWTALAQGLSQYRTSQLTAHTRSAIVVVSALLGTRFEVEGEAPAVVRCAGRQ